MKREGGGEEETKGREVGDERTKNGKGGHTERGEADVEEGLMGNGAMRGRRLRYQRRIQMTLSP